MRRRSRRAPNNSESTGKTGAEIPSNQPAPLVPLYPDETPPAAQHGRPHAQAPSRPTPHPSSQAASHGGQPPRGSRPERQSSRSQGGGQGANQGVAQQWDVPAGA